MKWNIFVYCKSDQLKTEQTQNGCCKKMATDGSCVARCKVYKKKEEKRREGVDDGKKGSSQSADQSLQAWPLSRRLCSGRDHRPAATLKPSQAHSDR